MSYVTGGIKSKYHCGLDGQGLLLQGAPDRLAYQQGQAPVFGTRFASGDRSYNDLSQFWFFVQTSWAAGFKDVISWADDAKYYYATNIDAWSENGAIKLTRLPTLHTTLTENILCGAELEVNSVVNKYLGTGDDANGKPVVYKDGSNISDAQMTTNQNGISQMSARSGILWISTVGFGDANVVLTWTGSAFTDQTAYIDTLTTHQSRSSRCHVEYAGTMYVFRDNYVEDSYALVKTTVLNPSADANWSLVFERLTNAGLPIACAIYNGKIYYLVNYSTSTELRVYDIAADTDTYVQMFKNTSITNLGVGDKLLTVLNGKLIITIPPREIWQIDGSTLTRIFIRDEYKFNNLLAESYPYLGAGAVIADNKAFWGNLVYDGTYFYNGWKEVTDATSSSVYPMFVDSSGVIYHSDSVNNKKLYSLNLTGSTYKGSTDKNFLVFNNFDLVSGVDKLAYSLTLLFKPFVSGQSIVVEYLLGELSSSASWTTLGTASFALDAGTVTDKTFYFGAAVTFKKIWFRVKMTAGGSNTPTLTDFVVEYLPIPTFKKNWALNINCGDDVKRLDGALVSDTGRELKSRLERTWWTKSILDFQDLDYATTLLNGALTAAATTITVDDTKDFPEQGRLHIDDEEITYTGKTPTTFTGCIGGARSTRAVAHLDNAVINNAYKVIMTDFSARIPVALEDKELEYTVGLSLREV